MSKRPVTVAVDFDGVLHAYRKGWYDGTIYDEPVPGAKEGMQALLDRGFKVTVFTTRVSDEQSRREVEYWLNQHEIPYTTVWPLSGKPPYACLIDDRAVRFEKWDAPLLEEVQDVIDHEGRSTK